MAATYEPIATQTLGSAAGTISFTSIPLTYTDLFLTILTGGATAGASMRIRLNSDSGSNYSYTQIVGDGSSAASGRDTNLTSGQVGGATAGATTSLENFSTVTLMSYASTNVYKTLLTTHQTPSSVVDRKVNLWRSTSAVSSISLALGGSFPTYDMIAGTVAALYGIKAA